MSEIVTWTLGRQASRPKAKAEAIEPRKTAMRTVDAFDVAEDNTNPSVKGEFGLALRGLRARHARHCEHVATREIPPVPARVCVSKR